MTAPHSADDPEESLDDIRADEEGIASQGALYYPSVLEFVTDRLCYLVPLPAPGAGRVWCAEWFRHAQALSRLDSLWRAWEMLRLDPALGISNWWTYHADPQLRSLMDAATGPFAQCVGGHRDDTPLPLASPPDGLFLDQRLPWHQPSDPFAL